MGTKDFDVKRHDGEELLIPEGMTEEMAKNNLTQFFRLEGKGNEIVRVSQTFPYLRPDGAHAFMLAVEEMFGEALQNNTGRFGEIPPKQIAIEVAPGETAVVPWGEFSLPGIEGSIETDASVQNGLVVFELVALIREKDVSKFRELTALTGKILESKSIYKGKAINASMAGLEPRISFISPNSDLFGVFNDHLQRSIDSEVMLPIRYPDQAKSIMGGSLKRGILLAGVYGTGKTLTAVQIAAEATKDGWTFVYVKDSSELAKFLEFAKMYSPAVVFAEDIDLVVGRSRDGNVNEILNVLDGVDSKNDQIVTVMTTNSLDDIHKAMMRPGRIDSVIKFDLPDAKTAGGIVRMHGGEDASALDLDEVGELLAGIEPALIVEVVRRARLRALSESGGKNYTLAMQNLEEAFGLVKLERGLVDTGSLNGVPEKIKETV